MFFGRSGFLARVVVIPVLVVGAAAGAVASACGGGGDDDGATTLNVELFDWGIRLDRASVPAGPVQVKAKNTGSTEHEVVFVRTDLPEDKLPIKEGEKKVDEEKVEVVGEVEKFPAGKTEKGKLDLPAGRYVVICNIATHYGLGMHTVLTVQ